MGRTLLAQSRRRQHGHGLAEYCLVAAFISLVALGLYLRMSGGMHDLWSTANSTLVNGAASSTAASQPVGHASR